MIHKHRKAVTVAKSLKKALGDLPKSVLLEVRRLVATQCIEAPPTVRATPLRDLNDVFAEVRVLLKEDLRDGSADALGVASAEDEDVARAKILLWLIQRPEETASEATGRLSQLAGAVYPGRASVSAFLAEVDRLYASYKSWDVVATTLSPDAQKDRLVGRSTTPMYAVTTNAVDPDACAAAKIIKSMRGMG